MCEKTLYMEMYIVNYNTYIVGNKTSLTPQYDFSWTWDCCMNEYFLKLLSIYPNTLIQEK